MWPIYYIKLFKILIVVDRVIEILFWSRYAIIVKNNIRINVYLILLSSIIIQAYFDHPANLYDRKSTNPRTTLSFQEFKSPQNLELRVYVKVFRFACNDVI